MKGVWLLQCLVGSKSTEVAKIIATLTLGSRPRQGLAKVQVKSEPESHISCSQECKRVLGNEPTHS
jgi:hypothetical protein